MLKTVGFPSTRTGNQTIIDGNLVIGTAGKGIDFSVDPSAPGMTSELLDDYEEGTWTPSFVDSGGGTPSQTSTGRYTKIGNVVYFWFECILSIPATDLYFTTNFPFVPAVTTSGGSAGIGGISDKIYPITAINDGRIRAFVTATTSFISGIGSIRV
jgi:hypothetical protein